VLVENNAPEQWKQRLGYNTLKEINPKLVMTAITPFGQKGPYKDYKAYNINCCGTGACPSASATRNGNH